MSTGVESWSSIKDKGAIYTFVGSEGLYTVLYVDYWLVWQVWQNKTENTTMLV